MDALDHMRHVAAHVMGTTAHDLGDWTLDELASYLWLARGSK